MPNIVLRRFIIFNSSEGQQEGQEQDKLIYHWTRDAPNNKVDISDQVDDVCLCDASVSASIRLQSSIHLMPFDLASPDQQGCEIVGPIECSNNINASELPTKANSKNRSLVLTFESMQVVVVEVEPDLSIWMAVHVGLTSSAQEQASLTASTDSSQIFNIVAGHLSSPESIPTPAIERIINNIYSRFCLINGTFKMIIDEILRDKVETNPETKCDQQRKTVRERIRTICCNYFGSVLSEVHLSSMMTNLPSLNNYIVYLDLNPVTLMRVNSFINHLICIDAQRIRHTIAIFNDQLLWSSMNMHDTRLLYNYLVAVPIRDAMQEELTREMDKVRRIRENMPIYLNDISDDMTNVGDSLSALSISGRNERPKRRLSKFYLTLFRSSNNMTLGLILKEAGQPDLIQKCEYILTSDSRMGVIPLSSLAQSVGQNFLKSSSLSNTSASQGRPNKKKPTSSTSVKSQIPQDQRYLCLDKLSASALWSPSVESGSQVKDQLPLKAASSDAIANPDLAKKNRKLRLTRHLLELEPELEDLKRQPHDTDGVEEFLAKTTSDTWLTVMNSKYKSIYSNYKMRNVGLTEAQQCANDLNAAICGARRKS